MIIKKKYEKHLLISTLAILNINNHCFTCVEIIYCCSTHSPHLLTLLNLVNICYQMLINTPDDLFLARFSLFYARFRNLRGGLSDCFYSGVCALVADGVVGFL